jgi:hypothetical protein
VRLVTERNGPVMRPTHSPCSIHRPRTERDLERALRAARTAHDAAQSRTERPALAAALAAIEATFNRAAVVNDLKITVERHIHRGAEHPAVRARFDEGLYAKALA